MNFYEQTVPVFRRGLNNLAVLLEKSRAHAEAAHFEMSALLGARLFPTVAGVLVIEAEKQIYAVPFDAVPARRARVLAQPARPDPSVPRG